MVVEARARHTPPAVFAAASLSPRGAVARGARQAPPLLNFATLSIVTDRGRSLGGLNRDDVGVDVMPPLGLSAKILAQDLLTREPHSCWCNIPEEMLGGWEFALVERLFKKPGFGLSCNWKKVSWSLPPMGSVRFLLS